MSAAGGRRVTLRPLDAHGNVEWPWLAESVAAVGGRYPPAVAETSPTAASLKGGSADRVGAGRGDPGSGHGGKDESADIAAWLRSRWPDAMFDIIFGDGEALGIVGWRNRTEGEEGRGTALEIVALAVRADRRNRGFGAEAVEALEERLGVARSYAVVPRGNGLAIYFWLHSGYRPLRLDESAARTGDPAHFWMVRALAG